MPTSGRSNWTTWKNAVLRFWREKPRRAVAIASAAAILSLSLGVVLTLPAATDTPASSVDDNAAIQEEEGVRHAQGTLDAKLAALKQAALADEHIDDTLQESMGYQSQKAPYVVFFSATDGKERAAVVNGTGETTAAAWLAAEEALRTYVREQSISPVWLKVDLLTHAEKVTQAELNKRVKACRENGFRYGLAFDAGYQTALLEAEVSASGAIDYDKNALDLASANIYLAQAERAGVGVMNNEVVVFTTKGYFCDENDEVAELSEEGASTGRRLMDTVDKQTIQTMTASAANYLADIVQDDGRFVYSYAPTTNKRSSSYNILRHCGAIWSLCQQAQVSGDSSLLLPVDQALEYLQTQIQQDGDAAFVVQSSASEVRLGGNALAILAMTEYATAFDSDAYDELIAQLAQGILRMQNDDGRFTHVLNAEDYSVKEQSRGTLYDGEATFALARAYGRTKQKNFLEGAKRAADWMGEQKYEQYGDHWVAYAMNELTKYAPEQRYFLLGIQNAQQHLEEIEQRETTSPTGLELLMATFELVGRAQTEHISINGVSGFGTKTLARAIQTRVNVMLDGYFYPELAMYMQRPQRVEGTFFVRQDAFRVRIDDVQHNMNAFYAYAQNYDAVQKAAK